MLNQIVKYNIFFKSHTNYVLIYISLTEPDYSNDVV